MHSFLPACLSVFRALRVACCVFCSRFITTFFNFKIYIHISSAVHIPLLICIYFCFTSIRIDSIDVCVYSNTYTKLPPSSRAFMFASKYASISPCIFLSFHRHLVFPYASLTCTCMYVKVHVCMWVYSSKLHTFYSCFAVCLYFLPTWLYICVLRAACFVFCCRFMSTFFFPRILYIFDL